MVAVPSRHHTWGPTAPSPCMSDMVTNPPWDIRPRDLPLANDIWWWSMETSSNFFIWGQHLVVVSETGSMYGFQAGSNILLECFLIFCIWLCIHTQDCKPWIPPPLDTSPLGIPIPPGIVELYVSFSLPAVFKQVSLLQAMSYCWQWKYGRIKTFTIVY